MITNNIKLIYVLKRYKNDPKFIKYAAQLLNYLPKEFEKDLSDLIKYVEEREKIGI